MKDSQLKYVVAWKAQNDSCVLVSLRDSKVGMAKGWYLFVFDDEMREGIKAGPFSTALDALNSQAVASAERP